jgi:hypothetical protein
MPTVEDLNFVRLSYVPRKTNASGAKDASFLIELYKRSEVECFSAAGFLSQKKAAVVAGVRHVVVLQPTLAGLVANRAIDGVVEEQELHCVPHSFMNPLSIGANLHVIRHGSCARRHEFWRSFHLNKTHAAAAFNPNVRMVAISWNLNANVIGQLDNRTSLFGLVHLAIDRDLRHKFLD